MNETIFSIVHNKVDLLIHPSIVTILLIISISFFFTITQRRCYSADNDDDDNNTSPTHTSSTGSNERPYTQWNHPQKYKVDKLLSFLFQLKKPFDFASFCNEPYHTSYYTTTTTSNSNKISQARKTFDVIESLMHTTSCYLWYHKQMKKEDNYLVYGTVCVHRQPTIIHDWNIGVVPSNDSNMTGTKKDEGKEDDDDVEIELTCSNMAIQNLDQIKKMSSSPSHNSSSSSSGWRYKLNDTKNDNGSSVLPLENFIFSPNCPIIIYFHGGGMVFGSSRDMTSVIDCVMNISSIQQHSQFPPSHQNIDNTYNNKSNKSNNNVILLSVTYRLAPENPFPSSIIDCLSAASYIIEKYSSLHEIHIGGFSAGGNLASVVGFECYRRYPGRIKSIMTIDPMTLPHTDTLSSYMNSLSSSFCPTKFVRFCWMAYLQREEENDDETKNFKSPSLSPSLSLEQCTKVGDVIQFQDFFKSHSQWYNMYAIAVANHNHENDDVNSSNNKTAPSSSSSPTSSSSSSSWIRLFHPQIDLPKSLKDKNAPLIIVRTSTADALRDDGLDLVRCLKGIGANVVHIESIGSHGISSIVDGGIGKKLLN